MSNNFFYCKWKQTGQIIHKLEVQSENIELCRTIQQFSLQMTQNPLIISPCGFIELGYSFVISVSVLFKKKFLFFYIKRHN